MINTTKPPPMAMQNRRKATFTSTAGTTAMRPCIHRSRGGDWGHRIIEADIVKIARHLVIYEGLSFTEMGQMKNNVLDDMRKSLLDEEESHRV